MPGAKVASTRRIFSAAVQRRRRWTEVMISTRSEVLVIRSVISLTLPKWETLSGHFGGNLTCRSPAKLESEQLPVVAADSKVPHCLVPIAQFGARPDGTCPTAQIC